MLIASVSRSSVFTRYERDSSQEIRVKGSIGCASRAASASHCIQGRACHAEVSSPRRPATVRGVKSARV